MIYVRQKIWLKEMKYISNGSKSPKFGGQKHRSYLYLLRHDPHQRSLSIRFFASNDTFEKSFSGSLLPYLGKSYRIVNIFQLFLVA